MTPSEKARLQNIYIKYIEKLGALDSYLDEINIKIIKDDDPFFKNYINLITKSSLVTVCSYIEMFLKEIFTETFNILGDRYSLREISNLYIKWKLSKTDLKSSEFDKLINLDSFELKASIEDFDSLSSTSPHKYKKLFSLIGYNYNELTSYKLFKSDMGRLNDKRIKIVHYDDSASDLAISDVKYYSNKSKSFFTHTYKAIYRKIK